jgi:hypothetical protein
VPQIHIPSNINNLNTETGRPRANSVKRKHDGSSYADITSKPSTMQQQVFNEAQREKIEEMALEITKVSSLCDKIGDTTALYEADSTLIGLLHNINNAIRGIVRVQEFIVKDGITWSQSLTVPKTPNTASDPEIQMVSLGNVTKRQRQGPSLPEPSWLEPTAKEQVDPEVRCFRDAVRTAENSTLVFNLDMGRVPIMNIETISNKATLALINMAAAKEEGNTTSVPAEDTITAIDDVLSVATNISFYGKKTKTYKNPKDSLSGSFCTVPVRYEFRDRETRIEAEKLFMDKCGAHCAIPYPTMLRECIKQVVGKVKRDYPNNQVRVNVDTQKLCLSVSRREKNLENPGKWNSYDVNIPLPKEALNIDTKTVPQGFRLTTLPAGPKSPRAGSPTEVSNVEMEAEDGD